MSLGIHNRVTRLLVSALVFLVALAVIVPHLMDVHPPRVVEILLWPMDILGPVIGELLPPHNIGTPEEPFYEATPIHLLAGLGLALFSILLYPIVTYLLLSLLSKVMRRKAASRHGVT